MNFQAPVVCENNFSININICLIVEVVSKKWSLGVETVVERDSKIHSLY